MRAAAAYDVLIVGAGPAGATCALALRDAGLRVALIDKSEFPRDKVCGDAIPARCEKVLAQIDPAYAQRLRAFRDKVAISGCRVVAPNRHFFDFHFHTPGYCSRRLDFDHFLVELVVETGNIDLLTGFEVTEIQRTDEIWLVKSGDNLLQGKLLIGCDGGQSRVARQLTGFTMDPAHHCAAVRAYYKGVADVDPELMEIHLLDDYLPGYFWIFPLRDDIVNVGFGMLSSKVAQHKIRLRQALPEIVAQAPGLRARFAGATLHGKIAGFGLPMGSRKVPMSGAGFMLCGDAASLIEPATGEGIGNAMLSGRLAALQAIRCFREQDFSAKSMRAYDREVHRKLWRDLRNKYRAQRLLGERRWLMNWLIKRANAGGLVSRLVKKVF